MASLQIDHLDLSRGELAVGHGVLLGFEGSDFLDVRGGLRLAQRRVAESCIALVQEVREVRREDEVVLREVEEVGDSDEQRELAGVGGYRVHPGVEYLSYCLAQRRDDEHLPLVQMRQPDSVLGAVPNKRIKIVGLT